MSGGGKGGSTTNSVQIPKFLEDAARQNIARADVLSGIGYTPYYGPDVAAMTPMQIAAMQGTNQAANAFGMQTVDPMAGMPQAQDFNGVQAYSSGSGFEDAVARLKAERPGQYAALMAPFINPVSGAAPASPFGPLVGPSTGLPQAQPAMQSSGGGGGNGTYIPPSMATQGGGFTSLADMFNGGGPGASGPQFSGGMLSSGLNSLGLSPFGSGGRK